MGEISDNIQNNEDTTCDNGCFVENRTTNEMMLTSGASASSNLAKFLIPVIIDLIENIENSVEQICGCCQDNSNCHFFGWSFVYQRSYQMPASSFHSPIVPNEWVESG